MNGACNVKLFCPAPLGKFHLISITKSISKIFISNFVFSQMEYTKYIGQDFYSVYWVMPQGWDFVGPGGAQGFKNLFFSNMVMWHIKLTGMTSLTEYK